VVSHVPDPVVLPRPRSGHWAAADLERLPDNGIRYEVLNGQLVVNGVPRPRHQVVLGWLLMELVSAAPGDYWVLPGVGVIIGDDEPIPDLVSGRGAFDADGRGIAAEQVELAVEIVSWPTASQDRMTKPIMYARAGIPNYWRIEIEPFDGLRPGESPPLLFAYTLGENGAYELVQRAAAGTEVVVQAPFDFAIDTGALLR